MRKRYFSHTCLIFWGWRG